MPGDTGFGPRNGPDFASTVTIAETESPLGAPGFAFAIDSRGAVAGFSNFVAGATTFTTRPCPPSGAFTLNLTYEREVRNVSIPCRLPPGTATPPAFETAPPPFVPEPSPVQTCPAGSTCALGPVAAAPPPALPTNPPASSPLPATPPAAPTPSPVPLPTACAIGFSGTAPTCAGEIIEQYSAAADGSGAHSSTLFADGSICDDDGCSVVGPLDWEWACPFAGRSGSNGTGGSNLPYQQQDVPYVGSTFSIIGIAYHDAAENNGSGVVYTEDSYCVGFTLPGT
jgi:hypothetical protein